MNDEAQIVFPTENGRKQKKKTSSKLVRTS